MSDPREPITKPERAVGAVEPAPKVVLAPSLSARRIASSRATEKYGAVPSTPSATPAPTATPRPGPAPAPAGYVFPAARASEVEPASSAKPTSLDLTVVPSRILRRAALPATERLERVPAPRAARRLPRAVVVGVALALSLGVIVLAFALR